MKKPISKLLPIIFIAGLLSGCATTPSEVLSTTNNSWETSVSSNNSSSNLKSSNSSKEPTNSKSSAISRSSATPISVTPPPSSVEHNPNNCENHVLSEEILVKASLIEKGIKHYHCDNCNADFNDYYYDLDEASFTDNTFMYDGNEHEILIDGVLPYGTHVVYEDNKLTEIGNKLATAKIYDENNNLLVEKKAYIKPKPTPPAPKPTPAPSDTITYVVKKGDTLGQILRNYGYKGTKLFGDNGLAQKVAEENKIQNRGLIYPNQKIVIRKALLNEF